MYPSLTDNRNHYMGSAVYAGDVVDGHAGVLPAQVFGKRRCDILRHIGDFRTIEGPHVVALWS